MKAYETGETVEWNWGNGTGSGTVDTVFREKVTRTINGSKITRNASKDDPAYLIRQEDGGRVLKSHSELSRAG